MLKLAIKATLVLVVLVAAVTATHAYLWPSQDHIGSPNRHGFDRGYVDSSSGFKDNIIIACNNEPADGTYVKVQGYYGRGKSASSVDKRANGKCVYNYTVHNLHNHRLYEESNGWTPWSVHLIMIEEVIDM